MALRTLRRSLLAGCIIIFLIAPNLIYSCGPFLNSAIFAFEDRPDARNENFADGQLGIVRPEFRQAYLVVAYRYLAGLKLNSEQQQAALDVWDHNVVPPHPDVDVAINAWIAARNKVAGLQLAPAISANAAVSQDQPYFQYVNCAGDAFQNAARTLDDRAAKFGVASAEMREWVSAQDQVFGNCDGTAHLIPATLNSGDATLRSDRAYQIAAAHFYARDFGEAAAEFEAIAQDRSSPWKNIGSYLAARALIRKANLAHKDNESFDQAAMAEAEKRLAAMVADPDAKPIHDAALKLLNYVRFRTEPEKRVAELDRMLVQPDPDKNFRQDLWDYVVLLSHGQQSGDPSTWIQTFQAAGKNYSGVVREQTAKQAVSKWQETKSLPWLIAALTVSDSHSTDLRSLMMAASEIPKSSPGYLTVRYYALRLMVASGQASAARNELDTLLKSASEIPLGSRNLLNEERLKLSTSLEDFLQHAPETPVPAEVDFNTGEMLMSDEEPSQPSQPLFNHYAAETFQKRLPLAELIRAAESPLLPKYLRRELGRSAWVRAILVNDLDSAGKLQSVLQDVDPPLWKMMEPFYSATNAAEKHFATVFVILANPGLNPSVRESSLRTTTLGEIENYKDNWWCTNITPGSNWGQSYEGYDKNINLKFTDPDAGFSFPAWLSDAQKAEAKSEWTKLSDTGTAPNYLANQVLDFASRHSQDPLVPQALHLVVRSTRYGCTNVETSKLSKAAFDFLHNHYPQSEWAAKTKYFY